MAIIDNKDKEVFNVYVLNPTVNWGVSKFEKHSSPTGVKKIQFKKTNGEKDIFHHNLHLEGRVGGHERELLSKMDGELKKALDEYKEGDIVVIRNVTYGWWRFPGASPKRDWIFPTDKTSIIIMKKNNIRKESIKYNGNILNESLSSPINLIADKIPMDWVNTKNGKKKFIEFKKLKEPKGIIYHCLVANSPEDLKMTQSFNDLLISAIKIKGGLKSRALIVKNVSISYNGKQWLKITPESEVIVIDNNGVTAADKIAFRGKVSGTDNWEAFKNKKQENLSLENTEETPIETIEEAFQDAAGSIMGNGIGGEGMTANERGLFEKIDYKKSINIMNKQRDPEDMENGGNDVEDIINPDKENLISMWDNGSFDMIKKIAEDDYIDISQYDPREVDMGMGVELEHGSDADSYNITNDDPLMTLKIVLAHLDEHPNYYTLLFEVGIEDKPALLGEEMLDEEVLPSACDFSTQDEDITMNTKKNNIINKNLKEGFRIINGKLYDGAGQMIGDEKGVIPFKDRKSYGSKNNLKINEDEFYEPKEKPIKKINFDNQRVEYLESDLNKMLKFPKYMELVYIYRVGKYTYKIYFRSEDGKIIKEYYMDLDLGGQNYGPSDISTDGNNNRMPGVMILCWSAEDLNESIKLTNKIIKEVFGKK